MSEPFKFVTPPGRLISGSTTELQKTDHQNRPKPQDKWNYFIGVAIRKDDPASTPFIMGLVNMVWASEYARNPNILNAAKAVMDRGFPAGNVGFAWKITDGDAPGPNGQVYEHSRGCWVLKFSSMFALKCCNNQNAEISPEQVKRGYYVDISGTANINGNTDGTAGIYLNPSWVRLLGYGPEITGGPTAEQAFGAAPASLPQGASATPVAGPNAGAPGGGMPGTGPTPGFPGAAQQPSQAAFPGASVMPGSVAAPQPGNAPGFTQQPQANGLPGSPQAGMPTSPTAFPINPQTGQPVQPHPGFVPGFPGQ